MVNRIVGWVVLVPLCLGLIVFALANRHFVVVNFNPFAPVETSVAKGLKLMATKCRFARANTISPRQRGTRTTQPTILLIIVIGCLWGRGPVTSG